MINPSFWKGKRVFVTGHTGFKGGWICLWLKHLGAEVIGYSLEPATVPSLFEVADVDEGMQSIIGDIRDHEKLSKTILQSKPDVVIHMAAQPLVRYSYSQPAETYEVNVMGTVYLLEALRATPSVKAVVNVTSDKCYENQERIQGYSENEAMGGRIPILAGLCGVGYIGLSSIFLRTSGHHLAALELDVIGGDWAADRLIPDFACHGCW